MGLILPSVEAVIPPQVRLGSSEAVSQAGSSHLRAQAHLRHRSLDQVREDGSRLLHGRRRDIGAERIAQTRTSALAWHRRLARAAHPAASRACLGDRRNTRSVLV